MGKILGGDIAQTAAKLTKGMFHTGEFCSVIKAKGKEEKGGEAFVTTTPLLPCATFALLNCLYRDTQGIFPSYFLLSLS